MSEVTRILSQIESGDPSAVRQLLPVVYDELRRLAAARMTAERPDHTLDPTALVHEAFLRLVGVEPSQHFRGRGHFFAAAAEAMRRILIENARRRRRRPDRSETRRIRLSEISSPLPLPPDDLLALDEALLRLDQQDPLAARLVELRFFAGMTMPEAAEVLGISLRTAERNWTYARTWLHRELANGTDSNTSSCP
jgi:RNA polymerase sigma factor (TIGR02999 family)